MGDQPAADPGRPDDRRSAGTQAHVGTPPPPTHPGVQHGPPVDGRSTPPKVGCLAYILSKLFRHPWHLVVETFTGWPVNTRAGNTGIYRYSSKLARRYLPVNTALLNLMKTGNTGKC